MNIWIKYDSTHDDTSSVTLNNLFYVENAESPEQAEQIFIQTIIDDCEQNNLELHIDNKIKEIIITRPAVKMTDSLCYEWGADSNYIIRNWRASE